MKRTTHKKRTPPKIIIATGGTGGHIFTGLAITEELESLGAKVIIVGSKFGMERTIIKERYPIKFTCQRPLLGKNLKEKIEFPLFLSISLLQSIYILMKENPDAVIGTGGFGSFSIVFIATLVGLPTIITEIDSIPGLASIILSRFVHEVWLAFPQTKNKIRAKNTIIAGFPVRREITKLSNSQTLKLSNSKVFGLSAKKPTILIFGGSRGARHINEVVKDTFQLLPELQFIWQTGDWIQNSEFRIQNLENVYQTKFIEDMATAYRCAKLVIARAGALTIGELISAKLPSILIPFPYAAKNHQLLNARILEKRGATKIILDKELTPALLASKIREIIENEELQLKMKTAIESVGTPNAAQLIAKRILYKISR